MSVIQAVTQNPGWNSSPSTESPDCLLCSSVLSRPTRAVLLQTAVPIPVPNPVPAVIQQTLSQLPRGYRGYHGIPDSRRPHYRAAL